MFTYKTNRQIEYFGNLPVEGQATDNTGGWVRQGSGIFGAGFCEEISVFVPPWKRNGGLEFQELAVV